MTKQTWLLAAAIAAAILLLFAFRRGRIAAADAVVARAETAAAAERARALAETNALLVAALGEAGDELAEMRVKAEESARTSRSVEEQMRAELDSRDVTISELRGKLTVNILDRVLFDSGEARLRPDGEAVLLKVAALLGRFPRRQILVSGHTDNVPVRGRTAEGFTDNWSLSAGRATAAVRFLVEHGGVDPARIGGAGYGEHRPVADNATPEGRSRNRRIAVVLLPEEDNPAAPPGATNVPTAVPGTTADQAP